MSKYELELDDAEARAFVYDLRNDGSGLEKAVASQIERQIPPPTPTKVGAVVRTDKGLLVRVARDNDFLSEWWLLGESEHHLAQAKQWTDTPDLGRITEVLSEGVDL